MLFLEFVPLVVVHRAIPIQIQLFIYVLCGLGEMGLEFLPAHHFVSIRVHIPEMGVKRLGVRHGFIVMLSVFGATGRQNGRGHYQNQYKKSNKYSNHHDYEIGEMLLEIAYTKNSEMKIQKLRKEASRYIEVLSDYKECILGSNPFRLKRGEINKFWFRIPLGERLTVSILAIKMHMRC